MTHGLRQTAWYTPLFEQIDVPSGQIARVVSVNRWIAEDAAPFEVHHLFSQGENFLARHMPQISLSLLSRNTSSVKNFAVTLHDL
jgi:hypothetical protein